MILMLDFLLQELCGIFGPCLFNTGGPAAWMEGIGNPAVHKCGTSAGENSSGQMVGIGNPALHKCGASTEVKTLLVLIYNMFSQLLMLYFFWI